MTARELEEGNSQTRAAKPPRLAYHCLQATREGQGSYAHVHEIIGGLQRREWRVDLFQPRSLPGGSFWRRLRIGWEWLKPQISLWCGRRPDVLYIRSHFCAFPTALLARVRRIPTVQEMNGPYEDLLVSKPWTRKLQGIIIASWRKQLQWADSIIAITPQEQDWLAHESCGRPTCLIPCGANTDLFHPGQKCRVSVPKPYVLFFGLFAPWQHIGRMTGAVRDPSWPDGLHFVFAGDGPDREIVERAAREDKRIHYMGVVPYRDMPGLIAGSELGVVFCAKRPKCTAHSRSTSTEPLSDGVSPLKLYENMACGVPVVVADTPGQADVVKDAGAGLVVSLESCPRALAEAVARLHADPELRRRMGAAGRAAAVSQFSWDNRAEQTHQLLMTLLPTARQKGLGTCACIGPTCVS